MVPWLGCLKVLHCAKGFWNILHRLQIANITCRLLPKQPEKSVSRGYHLHRGSQIGQLTILLTMTIYRGLPQRSPRSFQEGDGTIIHDDMKPVELALSLL